MHKIHIISLFDRKKNAMQKSDFCNNNSLFEDGLD